VRATLPSLEALDCLHHCRQNHHYVAIADGTNGGGGGGGGDGVDCLLHPLLRRGYQDVAAGHFSSDDSEIQEIR